MKIKEIIFFRSLPPKNFVYTHASTTDILKKQSELFVKDIKHLKLVY